LTSLAFGSLRASLAAYANLLRATSASRTVGHTGELVAIVSLARVRGVSELVDLAARQTEPLLVQPAGRIAFVRVGAQRGDGGARAALAGVGVA